MKNFILLIRPKHWVKNLFVFMPLFFGGKITDIILLQNTIISFFAFCFAASAIYCYNDIIDIENDRKHTEKCKRPIASGAVSVPVAYIIMAIMIFLSSVTITLLNDYWNSLSIIIAMYLIMEIAYCHILKKYAIIDIITLSVGFIMRILAGSAVTCIVPSKWLILMTFLLTLFLGLAKRRDDVMIMLKTGVAPRHNTHRYNITFINQGITLTASVTLVCYIMYTLSPEVSERIHFEHLYLTTIFVICGLLRYMQMTEINECSGDPTKLIHEDHILQTIILFWIISFFIIIYLI